MADLSLSNFSSNKFIVRLSVHFFDCKSMQCRSLGSKNEYTRQGLYCFHIFYIFIPCPVIVCYKNFQVYGENCNLTNDQIYDFYFDEIPERREYIVSAEFDSTNLYVLRGEDFIHLDFK